MRPIDEWMKDEPRGGNLDAHRKWLRAIRDEVRDERDRRWCWALIAALGAEHVEKATRHFLANEDAPLPEGIGKPAPRGEP